jgi:SusD/RagB-like outer membrane lipoprotein
MKNILILSIYACLLLSACTKNLSGINNNPKASTTVPSTSLFLQGEKALTDGYTTTSVAVAPFRVIAQCWTENSYVYESQYNFAPFQAPDGYWNALYAGVIHNLEKAKALYPSDVVNVPNAGVLRNDLIITDILEIYTYNLLVNTYGNIPYSQAENQEIPFPKYDDAKTVFYDLLTRIDTCIAGLNTNAAAMGAEDQIYGGNITQWLKFAATLKLKMALMVADTDLPTATTKVQEAIATGIFQSNADNALFAYDPASPANSNPLWQALVFSGRHDFDPAGLLVSTMVGWNDPRLPLYFQQFQGAYSGGVAGSTNGYGLYSDFSLQLQQANYPGDILDYQAAEFLLAEAAARGMTVPGTASGYYNNAITASIEYWGGSATDAAAYLAQPAVAYATAGSNWKQVIGYQSWIAQYNGNWDAWTVIRRLGFPGIDIVSPPLGAQGNLPLRFTYPANEQTSNSLNWKAAAAALPGGKDVVSAKLFWMP